MTTIGEALIEVRADTSKVASDVEKGASPSKMGKAGSLAGKGLAVGFTAAAGGILAGGAFLKGAFDEAQEAQKVGAITANAIKATGGAANVSAKQVGDLAGAISAKAGIDDEAIQSGANLLLTFKNIRNEVGKGNDIFNQSTKAAVDLSAAGFGSIESASVLMGKALNDPIKGVSALGKSGVTFSEDQKAMIKSLVESGDLLGAQKIILGEVNGQVGGAAAAQATAADKMGVAWGNLKEQVGTALMPVFERLMTFVTNVIIPGISNLGPVFSAVKGFIGPVVGAVQGLFSSFGKGGGGGELTQLRTTFASVFGSIKTIVSSAVTIVKVLWNSFGATIVAFTRGTFANMLQVIRGAFQIIAGIFKIVGSLLKGDWKGVWEGIKQVLRGAWAVIGGVVKQGWNLIKTLFSIAGTVIKGIFGRMWDGVKTLASNAFGALRGIVSKGVSSVVDFIRGIPGKISALAGSFLAAGKSLGSKVIGGIGDGLRAAGGFVSDIAGSVRSAINSALHLPVHISGPGPLPDFDIPAFASGTRSAPGGLALVGENGPELVNLPRGSGVITAARTRAMARGVAGTLGGATAGALRLVSGTLTIDESGVAYIRGVAEDVVADAADFADTLGGMHR